MSRIVVETAYVSVFPQLDGHFLEFRKWFESLSSTEFEQVRGIAVNQASEAVRRASAVAWIAASKGRQTL